MLTPLKSAVIRRPALVFGAVLVLAWAVLAMSSAYRLAAQSAAAVRNPDDRLIDLNRKFREFLRSKDIRFTPIETPGAHNWMVWRRNLAEFGSLIFHEKTS